MPNTDLTSIEGTLDFKSSSIQGTGVFARRVIASGTRIIEYVGQVIDKQESLRRCEANNAYIFTLDAERDLDGNVGWNPAKFINHCCTPNCEAEWIDGQIWIVAKQDIQAGDEITFNYGYDLTDYQEHECRCGSIGCVGFMVAEEYFENIRGKVPVGTA